jgi:hypothetical protein
MDNSKGILLFLTLSLTACTNALGPGSTPRESLDATIIELRQCLPVAQICRPGDYIGDFPLDTSAVVWNQPFVIVGTTDWARYITWAVEWPQCRKRHNCQSKRTGPFELAQDFVGHISIVLYGGEPIYVILYAELDDQLVADTIGFDPPFLPTPEN